MGRKNFWAEEGRRQKAEGIPGLGGMRMELGLGPNLYFPVCSVLLRPFPPPEVTQIQVDPLGLLQCYLVQGHFGEMFVFL